MNDDGPSRTALSAALMRAVHTRRGRGCRPAEAECYCFALNKAALLRTGAS